MELKIHKSGEDEARTDNTVDPTIERRLETSMKKGSAALRRSAAALKKIEDILKSRQL
ncbi:hypothetical protein [Kaistia terrae]|uniref:Uncharacterized protein n=1 Tax=Kaistia terrae TaxID=537017 RepID=A0ABW0PZ46_9HYPH|nr:hypothetical protein [Kaistia terrae]MCX5580502.1 hypothetical protein [Kaistia terrae]